MASIESASTGTFSCRRSRKPSPRCLRSRRPSRISSGARARLGSKSGDFRHSGAAPLRVRVALQATADKDPSVTSQELGGIATAWYLAGHQIMDNAFFIRLSRDNSLNWSAVTSKMELIGRYLGKTRWEDRNGTKVKVPESEWIT